MSQISSYVIIRQLMFLHISRTSVFDTELSAFVTLLFFKIFSFNFIPITFYSPMFKRFNKCESYLS